MIKLNPTKMPVRTTTAPYEYTDDSGETITEQIAVRYFSRSITQTRELNQKLREIFIKKKESLEKQKQKGILDMNHEALEPVYLSEILPFQVESLPDIAGLDGKPIKTVFDAKGNPTAKTLANFEAMAAVNLDAIDKAIRDDIAPKSQPSN